MFTKVKETTSTLSPRLRIALIALTFVLASCGDGNGGDSSVSAPSGPVALNQGPAWNATNQASFYAMDQGSRIMPYSWAKALKLPNGQSFLSTLTTSAGYIPNPVSATNPEGLPVGFLVSDPGTTKQQLSMIWVAAPYLHNGSVPTLAALLTPAAARPVSFQVGPVYDLVKVGLAEVQPGGAATVRVTTDCSIMNGDSRCGHEFGTLLAQEEKTALIEYLKTL